MDEDSPVAQMVAALNEELVVYARLSALAHHEGGAS